jgi:hypothetical protein
VTPCPRPLDPIDAEAVAAGADPIFRTDAADHARSCAACQAAVDSARSLGEALEGLVPDAAPGLDLAKRVTRLRAFSSRERRTYALWNAPVLLLVGTAAAGLALTASPALSASDQVAGGAAALVPLLALVLAAGRWATDVATVGPRALEALAQGLREQTLLGAAALGLLGPLALGRRTVLARAQRRR